MSNKKTEVISVMVAWHLGLLKNTRRSVRKEGDLMKKQKLKYFDDRTIGERAWEDFKDYLGILVLLVVMFLLGKLVDMTIKKFTT